MSAYKSTKTKAEYFLHKVAVNGASAFLYYFSKKKREDRLCTEFPEGYRVVEAENGFPIMRRKKSDS